MDRFEGAGAMITGGASGIGLAVAKQLGAKGARLVLADIEQGALDSAVAAFPEAGVEAHGVDLRRQPSARASRRWPTSRSAGSARST